MKDLTKYLIAFGQVVSNRRTDLGFSREKLARITAINIDDIISIEDGSKDPTLSQMLIISIALGIKLPLLITLADILVTRME